MINFPMVYWRRPDPHTWTLRDVTTAARWSKIACANPRSILAAIAYSADTLTPAVTTRSQDGVVWTIGTAPIGQWEGLVWAQELGLFVAVANNSISASTVVTSPDGITYTTRSAYAATWADVGWNGTTLLAVEDGLGAGVMVSTNGTDWTLHANALQSVGTGWYAVKWFAAAGLWVATNGSLIATSPTGVTWTLRLDNLTAYQILSFAANSSVIVALSDTDTYVTSTDGVSWTTRSLGLAFVGRWQAVAWSGARFCAVAQTSTGEYSITSTTGTSGWTASNTVSALQWNAIAWSDSLDMFAALNINGTQKVMTSSTGL